MLLDNEREEVARYSRRLHADGLVVGTSGNLSARAGDLVAVTPSGLDYDQLTPRLVGVHDLDGTAVEAPLEPTSELPMHLAVYRSTDAQAIVHTHSTAATAVSTVCDELPAVHYLVALFGGDTVRVAEYGTYGTEALARNVVAALEDRKGCLMGTHGGLTIGEKLSDAYTLSLYLEWLCDVYLRASAHGRPRVLSPDEVERVAGRLSSYGQSPP